MPKRIVYTRPDGGVSVCAPSLTAHEACRGPLAHAILGLLCDLPVQEAGRKAIPAPATARHVGERAMQLGDCSMAEAYAIMRDRFCAHLGTGCELWVVEDVPIDRWFWDAWRRSHNGGPISVHLPTARRIQWERIKTAVETQNKPRLALGRKPLVPQWGQLGDAVRHARDENELRRVVADAVAPFLGCLKQALNLGLTQKILLPLMRIRRRGLTLNISPVGRHR